MTFASTFRTSLRRHNVIDVRNVFANKSSCEMISQCHKQCNFMQNKSGANLDFYKSKAMLKQYVISWFEHGFLWLGTALRNKFHARIHVCNLLRAVVCGLDCIDYSLHNNETVLFLFQYRDSYCDDLCSTINWFSSKKFKE